MKRMQTATLAIAAIAAIGLTTGCTTVQRGTAAGGALGATAGAIFGHNYYSAAVPGAAIGGMAGAATGGVAGDAYAKMTEEDRLREKENLDLRAQLDDAEQELAALREAGVGADTLARLTQLEDDLADARQELARKRGELDRADSELQSLRSSQATRDGEVARLRSENNELEAQAAELDRRLRDAEQELAAARSELDVVTVSLQEKQEAFNQVRDELSELNVELEQTSRGLTMTIVDQLLYKPGSADLSDGGRELLRQVADIIQTNYPNREVVVEGHTDNEPIRHSGWQSNWELGSARALTVLHELVEGHGFDPSLLSATTFGEFRPAASNTSTTGRAANRRSVLVILPEQMPVTRNQFAGL